MSKLYLGKIDVKKIDKTRLYVGKKGTYMNVAIWVNDKPDQYGNEISIQQSVKQGEKIIYLGEAKPYSPKTEPPDVNDQEPENESDLPF